MTFDTVNRKKKIEVFEQPYNSSICKFAISFLWAARRLFSFKNMFLFQEYYDYMDLQSKMPHTA